MNTTQTSAGAGLRRLVPSYAGLLAVEGGSLITRNRAGMLGSGGRFRG